jgi:hypothetical protein
MGVLSSGAHAAINFSAAKSPSMEKVFSLFIRS